MRKNSTSGLAMAGLLLGVSSAAPQCAAGETSKVVGSLEKALADGFKVVAAGPLSEKEWDVPISASPPYSYLKAEGSKGALYLQKDSGLRLCIFALYRSNPSASATDAPGSICYELK